MNDQVGYLHFFANFDSGNLESATLEDPLLEATSSSSLLPQAAASGDGCAAKRRLAGPAGRMYTLKDQHYYLNISPDCAGQGSFESSHNRSWFYFGVTFVGDQESEPPSPRSMNGSSSKLLRPSARHKATFTIVNLLATNLIFEHDNRPVYCSDTMDDWERLPQPLVIQYFDKSGTIVAPPPPSFLQQFHAELSRGTYASAANNPASDSTNKKFQKGWHQCSQRISWNYTFTSVGETVHFAMCYPFSYHRQSQLIEEWRTRFGDDRGKSHLYESRQEDAVSNSSSSDLQSLLLLDKQQRRRTPPPHSLQAASAPTTPAKAHIQHDGSPRAYRQAGNACAPPSPPTMASGVSYADPSEGVYFCRETLCSSIQNRRVDLLTISGNNGKQEGDVREPYINLVYPLRSEAPRPHEFPNKKIVLITSRVHPAETPASHVLTGLIEFLLSNADPRSVALRQKFVFKIVPILNPDGVACGHYRTDTRGVNLNRMYDNPDPKFHPTIHAARELFLSLEATKRLVLYVDLHAHASKRGCFVFGNAWDDDETQVQALLYPKLIGMNSMHFDFPSCDFTSRSMRSGNRTDGTTKGGTGRVALASSGGLVECYTLEASYCMGLSVNPVIPLEVDRVHMQTSRNKGLSDSQSSTQRRSSRSHSLDSRRSSTSIASSSSCRYSPDTYHELGRGIAIALLDLKDCNPVSRLPFSTFHSIDGVRSWLEKQLRLLHTEQMRADSTDKRKSTLENNRAMEKLGASLHLPTLNAYNNVSQHKLTRSDTGTATTLKAMRDFHEHTAPAPLRLLA